jgi:hypothetical protein
MNETVATYRMNPAEDAILFGDELTEGMWVLADDPSMRRPYGKSEDDQLRAQRFRKVTRLRREPACGGSPAKTVFVAEWIDGYQDVHSYAVTHGWIVKKAVTDEPAAED